jgi:hypothetical protein
MREREPLAAICAFVTHLLAAELSLEKESGAAGGAGALHLRAAVLAGGGGLLTSLLVCGVETCPSQLRRPLSGCLHGLLQLSLMNVGGRPGPLCTEVASWLQAAWTRPVLAGAARAGHVRAALGCASCACTQCDTIRLAPDLVKCGAARQRSTRPQLAAESAPPAPACTVRRCPADRASRPRGGVRSQVQHARAAGLRRQRGQGGAHTRAAGLPRE